MKISQKMQSEAIKQTQINIKNNQSFDQIVQSKTKQLDQLEIQNLMKEIVIQGEKLAHLRTFRDLAKFKRLVKGFLEKTVYNGLELKKSHHFSFDGRSQKLAIIDEVNAKLLELTEGIMDEEKKTVNLLGMIGEIKGLLINLYM